MFNFWALLTVADILSVCRMECELQLECGFGGCSLTTTGELKNDNRWRPGWVPVMASDGDKVVIDLDPGPEGKVGPVFYWYNAGGTPLRVAAGSWAIGLDTLAEELVARRFTLDKSGALWLQEDRFL